MTPAPATDAASPDSAGAARGQAAAAASEAGKRIEELRQQLAAEEQRREQLLDAAVDPDDIPAPGEIRLFDYPDDYDRHKPGRTRTAYVLVTGQLPHGHSTGLVIGHADQQAAFAPGQLRKPEPATG